MVAHTFFEAATGLGGLGAGRWLGFMRVKKETPSTQRAPRPPPKVPGRRKKEKRKGEKEKRIHAFSPPKGGQRMAPRSEKDLTAPPPKTASKGTRRGEERSGKDHAEAEDGIYMAPGVGQQVMGILRRSRR